MHANLAGLQPLASTSTLANSFGRPAVTRCTASHSVSCQSRSLSTRAVTLPTRCSLGQHDDCSKALHRAKDVRFLLPSISGIASLFMFAPSLKSDSSGGSGGGNGNEGGGGGDGNGHTPQHIADLAADDDDSDDSESSSEEEEEEGEGEEEGGEEEEEEEGRGGDATRGDVFFCGEVQAVGLPQGKGVPTEDELFAALKCQPGFECSRADVSEDLKTLYQTGLFSDVDARVEPVPGKKNKSRLQFIFKEKLWPEMVSFSVQGSKILPDDVPPKVMDTHEGGPTTVQTLAHIKNIVEGWYQDRGYVFGYISHFDGMESGNIIANVVEGRVNSVDVVYMDEQGNPKNTKGQIAPDYILREAPFKRGELYNTEDGRRALRDIFATGLFENVQVVPKQSMKDETAIDVDVMVKERPMKTCDVECEWGIAPGDRGKPGLVSIVPGGQISFEDRNVGGQVRTLSASISAQNFLSPADDLSFRAEYRHPYIWGDYGDPNKTSLVVSAFNARKLSGVFHSDTDDIPPVWVDRSGAKVALAETYSRNSKGTFGVVLEQVTTRDESGQVCTHGMRQSGLGSYTADGPPTTITDTGVDRLIFLQGNVTRDTTYFLNGTPIGARDIFTVDQSVLGSGFPFFNKHTASSTRFIKLKSPSPNSKMPPPVLVLHGKYGNCIGDMASYDYFTLGGPNSVRGYNVGEIASCRSFLETAVELRVPVPMLNNHVYAFYEHGTDLGSSKECRGNPTQYYRKAGKGSSWGGGVRLGAVRAEYVVDGNAGKGSLFVRFGDRF